jgi:hypothetical protein
LFAIPFSRHAGLDGKSEDSDFVRRVRTIGYEDAGVHVRTNPLGNSHYEFRA